MMREGEGGGGWGGGRNNQQQFDRTTTTTIINENYAPSINNYNNSHFAPSDFDVSYEVNDITLTTPLTLLLGHSGLFSSSFYYYYFYFNQFLFIFILFLFLLFILFISFISFLFYFYLIVY